MDALGCLKVASLYLERARCSLELSWSSGETFSQSDTNCSLYAGSKCSEDLKRHALELTLWVSCNLLNGYIRGQGPAVAQVKPSGSYENFQGWK